MLIAFASRADDPRLIEQVRANEALVREADDRDLRIAKVEGDRVFGLADNASALRARLRIRSDGFGIVLVGKDGAAAVSSASPLSAAELAGRIDAMPMRRGEMRRTERDR